MTGCRVAGALVVAIDQLTARTAVADDSGRRRRYDGVLLCF
jgi:hypothetical protein